MKKFRIVYIIAILMCGLHACTYLLMPLSENSINQRHITLAMVGAVYWLTLIISIAGVIVIKQINRHLDNNHKRQRKSIPVFANIPQSIADAALIGAIVVIVILFMMGKESRYIAYVDIAMGVFALYAHFLFENTLYKRIKKTKERKKQ